MPTANRSRNSRGLAILLGYNLPLLLWTMAAIVQAAGGTALLPRCPIHALLGWCPGCGLTTAYSRLLATGHITSPWFALVLGGLLVNLAWSIVKAWRVKGE